MRILVTGTSGFIGSNLVEKLWDDINDIENYQNELNDIDEVYHLTIG